jgi:hypothetical protein
LPLQHPVLHHFGVGGQRPEWPAVERGEHRVGNVARAQRAAQVRHADPVRRLEDLQRLATRGVLLADW